MSVPPGHICSLRKACAATTGCHRAEHNLILPLIFRAARQGRPRAVARTVAALAVRAVSLLLLTAPQGLIVFCVPEKIQVGGQIETMRFVMAPGLSTLLVFLVGRSMGIGKAAVYGYLPEYFPKDAGTVGGLVVLLGALGGFFLPPLFACSFKATGIPQTTFAILFLITLTSFAWLHWVVYRLLRQATQHLRNRFEDRK